MKLKHLRGKARTAEIYLAGLGASGALVAGGIVILLLLVGSLSFSGWLRAAGFGGADPGAEALVASGSETEVAFESPLEPPATAADGRPPGRAGGGDGEGGGGDGSGRGGGGGGPDPEPAPIGPEPGASGTGGGGGGGDATGGGGGSGNAVNDVGNTVNQTINGVGSTVNQTVQGVGNTVNQTVNGVTKGLGGGN